jgi:hypothetical protein
MPTIYISDSGDDKNDGLSLQTPVYSLKRAKELHGGRNDCSWHFGPRAWERIKKELSEKDKRQFRFSRSVAPKRATGFTSNRALDRTLAQVHHSCSA